MKFTSFESTKRISVNNTNIVNQWKQTVSGFLNESVVLILNDRITKNDKLCSNTEEKEFSVNKVNILNYFVIFREFFLIKELI